MPMTLQSRVGNMDVWEKELLNDLHFIHPEATVWEALCSGRCCAASDGLAPHDQGSFGWILSTSNGDCLARCNRPVFGRAISSYQAKAFGMLSFLQFLIRLAKFNVNPGQKPLAPYLVCDNQ